MFVKINSDVSSNPIVTQTDLSAYHVTNWTSKLDTGWQGRLIVTETIVTIIITN